MTRPASRAHPAYPAGRIDNPVLVPILAAIGDALPRELVRPRAILWMNTREPELARHLGSGSVAKQGPRAIGPLKFALIITELEDPHAGRVHRDANR